MTTLADLKTELAELTVASLQSLCGELRIKGRSRMRKAELIDALAQCSGIEALLEAQDREPGRRQPDASTQPAEPAENPFENPAEKAVRERAGGPRSTAEAFDEAPELEPSGSPGGLGLLAVDPCCVFVFWDADPDEVARARDRLDDPQCSIVLRMYGVGGVEPESGKMRGRFDLFVDGPKGQRYLELSAPGRTVYCELGLDSRDGRFLAFAWSPRLEMPRGAEASADEVRRMIVAGAPSEHWQSRGAPRPGTAEPALDAVDEGSAPSREALDCDIMPRPAHLFGHTDLIAGSSSRAQRHAARSESALERLQADLIVHTPGVAGIESEESSRATASVEPWN